jgi:hypothetical protein
VNSCRQAKENLHGRYETSTSWSACKQEQEGQNKRVVRAAFDGYSNGSKLHDSLKCKIRNAMAQMIAAPEHSNDAKCPHTTEIHWQIKQELASLVVQ